MRKLAMILSAVALFGCGASGDPIRPTADVGLSIGSDGVSPFASVGASAGPVSIDIGL